MPCDLCGRDIYPLYGKHSVVSRVTSRLGIRETLKGCLWVCEECLTPHERYMMRMKDLTAREAAFPKQKPAITIDEYQLMQKRTRQFRCPRHKEIGYCQLEPFCQVEPECNKVIEAMHLLQDVMSGRVKVISEVEK